MQCFDTFRGFIHKLYAATMDGKGREGTYIFFSRPLGAAGAGHKGAAAPLAHRWRRIWVWGSKFESQWEKEIPIVVGISYMLMLLATDFSL